MIVSSLPGTVTLAASPSPPLPTSVLLDPDPPAGLPVEIELDLSVPQDIAGPGVQRCGYVVKVGDEFLRADQWVSAQVSMSIDDMTPRWRVEAPLPSPFGSIAEHRGAPPGLLPVNIFGAYLTGTGLHLIPLVTDGMVDNASHSLRDGRKIGLYEGGGSALRYDRRTVEYSRPPGHGLNRGVVVAEIARAAGWTRLAIAPGGRMDKAIDVTADDAWMAVDRELMQTDGLALLEDGAGYLTTVVDGYNPGRPVDLELRLTDIGTDFGADPPGDILTRVTVTATAQVVREGCDRHTEIQTVTSKGIYAPKVAASRQTVSTFSATGFVADPASLVVVSRVETHREYECDTLIAERVFSWGWHNPLAARYSLQTDGSRLKAAATVYLYEGADGDDSMAYEWVRERFVLIGYQETVHEFDERGFRVRSVTRKAYPLWRKAAIRSRPNTGTPWDEADHIAGRLVLGNGSGVWQSAADPNRFCETMPRLSPTHGLIPGTEMEIEVVDYDVTDDGYLQAETRTRSLYFSPAGSLWQYAGEDGRAQEIEQFGEYEIEAVTYAATLGDTEHSVIRSVTRESQIIEQTVEHGREGYLPAAERRLDILAPADSFDTPEQAEAARAASRYETAEIGAESIDWTLEGYRGRNEAPPVSAPWAETPEECQAIGARFLREGAAVAVSASLAGCNWLLRPGWRLRVRGIADLIDDAVSPDEPVDLFVRDVEWPMAGPDGPIITEIGGKHYLS